MLRFMKNLVGVKMNKAANAGIEALVRWDPKSASEAELRTMEQHLDDLGREVALARQSYDKEKKEADAIQALSQQRMAAAEHLNRQMELRKRPRQEGRAGAESRDARNHARADGARDRARKEGRGGRQGLSGDAGETYAEAGGKLRSARSDLERAQRDMGRAAQQREQADRQAEAARRAAGLVNTTSSLTVALKAMQDAAAKDLASADAAMSKAKLLKPTQPEKEDPNIAAALAAASGKPAAPQSLSERLARLRQ